MVVYNDLSSDEPIRIFDKGVTLADDNGAAGAIPLSYRYGDISSPHLVSQEPLDVQDRHLIDCVRTGAVPLTDGENGMAVVRVLEAAEASLAEDRPVVLEDASMDRHAHRLASAL